MQMRISVNGWSYLHLIYVFFVNFLSPENIFHKYSPTFSRFRSNLVVHNVFKSLFKGHFEMILE